MSDLVWVELADDKTRLPIRIFKNQKLAFAADVEWLTEMEYGTAVKLIRHQLFVKSDGYCELGGEIVTENSAHMHERLHRGRFDAEGRSGEISLSNSIIVCAICHRRQHPEREIQFTRRHHD